MKRPKSHQIDELAQRVFRDSLPPTWVVNAQSDDYAKDYLVEIGENNGDLSGSSFFVQLKGQERPEVSADGMQVKFPLETKHTAYYIDKIKDLPVFLVVIDVRRKKGWWLFLQPALEEDQAWRQRDSVTIDLPILNLLTETDALRQAVERAKKWMRLHHPESIHDSVLAHKEEIRRKDPRFDLAVSLVNDQPMFTLLPKEVVPLTFTFVGDRQEMEKKITELVDKGEMVVFQPGEVTVTGSRLLEQIEEAGCSLQAAVTLKGTLTVIACDAEAHELARLSDIPGRMAGGRKELWFKGELTNSPLAVVLGPIAIGAGGSLQVNFNFQRWDGQRLKHLAYFDRLHSFFRALPTCVTTTIECERDGNTVFSVTMPFRSEPFLEVIAVYLEILWRARRVAEHFEINPVWTFEAFDRDEQDTAEQLYAVFFGSGWSQANPGVKLTTRLVGESIRRDVLKEAVKPIPVKLASDHTCTFMGEKLELGRLVFEYTEMSVCVKNNQEAEQNAERAKLQKKQKSASTSSHGDTIEVTFIGNESTMKCIRKARAEDT
jgi:Domain of unknown function (DUF4365)